MTRKRKSSAPHQKVPLNRKAAIKPVEFEDEQKWQISFHYISFFLANPNSQFYFLTAHKDQKLVYIYVYIEKQHKIRTPNAIQFTSKQK